MQVNKAATINEITSVLDFAPVLPDNIEINGQMNVLEMSWIEANMDLSLSVESHCSGRMGWSFRDSKTHQTANGFVLRSNLTEELKKATDLHLFISRFAK